MGDLNIKQKLEEKFGEKNCDRLYNYIYDQLKKHPKSGNYIESKKSDRVLILEEHSKDNLIPVVWYDTTISGFSNNPSFSVIDFEMLTKDEIAKELL